MIPEESPIIGLSKERKIGFVLLLVFGILAVTLGVLQIRNTMMAPFALNTNVPPIDKEMVNDINVLRYRDTDKDGLNDFDELYVYQTSPYLEDTDSDGVADKQEITKGSNPNCAEGKECVSGEETTVVSTSSTLSGMPGPQAGANPGEAPTDFNQLFQDPKQVREMLLSAGMEKSLLDVLSDSELMNMVAEIMSSSTAMSQLEQQINNVSVSGTQR